MSIVIGIITENKAYIASDGRVKNELNGDTLTESMNKTLKLSESVVIGFSGYFDRCAEIISYLIHMDTSNADIVAQEIHTLFKGDFSKNRVANFIIAGSGMDGKPKMFTLGTGTDGRILSFGVNSYTVIYPNDIPDKDYFTEIYARYPHLSLPRVMDRLISHVSTLSLTVNNQYFHQELDL